MSGVSLSDLDIHCAAADELPEVLSILTEAARWARDAGVLGHWEVPYPEQWVRPSLERGEVYLVRLRDADVGTLTFRWTDPLIWGEQPADSGYVHRLAIRRSAAGLGVGAAMLQWCDDQLRKEGRRYLRLDCRSTHAGLRRYYLRAGFEILRNATVNGMEVVLFQRAVSSDAR